VRTVYDSEYSSSQQKHDFSSLKVNINDKIQKIVDILAKDEIDGYIMFEGKLIDTAAMDETFAKKFIKNDA
jgi:hypothetical protein